ncbi:transposase [Planctomicrobium sp. SH668]|uniref:transposase n=1 Tax=Planctomicrobium sp. SH668 TaxID=3448126 RepID=UPI003F5CBA67
MTTHNGIPLANTLTAANVPDLRQLLPLVFLKFPKIGGKRGRPLDRPRSVIADKGYDCQTTRDLLAVAGIETHIPKRGTRQASSLGGSRWPVERTIAWLKQFRRIRIRWDRREEIFQAFHDIANSLITWRFLNAD